MLYYLNLGMIIEVYFLARWRRANFQSRGTSNNNKVSS